MTMCYDNKHTCKEDTRKPDKKLEETYRIRSVLKSLSAIYIY